MITEVFTFVSENEKGVDVCADQKQKENRNQDMAYYRALIWNIQQVISSKDMQHAVNTHAHNMTENAELVRTVE